MRHHGNITCWFSVYVSRSLLWVATRQRNAVYVRNTWIAHWSFVRSYMWARAIICFPSTWPAIYCVLFALLGMVYTGWISCSCATTTPPTPLDQQSTQRCPHPDKKVNHSPQYNHTSGRSHDEQHYGLLTNQISLWTKCDELEICGALFPFFWRPFSSWSDPTCFYCCVSYANDSFTLSTPFLFRCHVELSPSPISWRF